MEEKLSKKGLQRMYRRTKDCTAMILYNDEVAGSYMDFFKGSRAACAGRYFPGIV